MHFAPNDADALAEVLREVDFSRFSPEAIAQHAHNFSVERFQMRIKEVVDRVHGGEATEAQQLEVAPA
jgi:hypothetical protein